MDVATKNRSVQASASLSHVQRTRGVRLATSSAASAVSATRLRTATQSGQAQHMARGQVQRSIPSPATLLGRIRDAVMSLVTQHRVVVIGIGLILITVVALYGPTRDWYTAYRRGQDLRLRYESISAENDELENELNRLHSRDGIEDEARRRGYIIDGETSVVVENLPEELNNNSGTQPTGVTNSNGPGFFTRVLDRIFGYEET